MQDLKKLTDEELAALQQEVSKQDTKLKAERIRRSVAAGRARTRSFAVLARDRQVNACMEELEKLGLLRLLGRLHAVVPTKEMVLLSVRQNDPLRDPCKGEVAIVEQRRPPVTTGPKARKLLQEHTRLRKRVQAVARKHGLAYSKELAEAVFSALEDEWAWYDPRGRFLGKYGSKD